MTPVVVLGAGGHARVVVDALQCAHIEIEGVVAPIPVTDVLGVPFLGSEQILLERDRRSVILANGIGSIESTDLRADVFQRFAALGFEFVQVIHPTATVARSAHLGKGTQVMAGAVVQAGARLGNNVIVNTNASVDHDCVIGDHVHIAPGATLSGGVHANDGVHVGAGAVVLQGRTIGTRSVVGAGAVVDRDVPAETVVVGVPARERVKP